MAGFRPRKCATARILCAIPEGMTGLFIFLGTLIGGWFGWWLGAQLSEDISLALLLSGVGTIAGVVAGWWVARKIVE